MTETKTPAERQTKTFVRVPAICLPELVELTSVKQAAEDLGYSNSAIAKFLRDGEAPKSCEIAARVLLETYGGASTVAASNVLTVIVPAEGEKREMVIAMLKHLGLPWDVSDLTVTY